MFSSSELDALMARIISQPGQGPLDIHRILAANKDTAGSSNKQKKLNITPHPSPQKLLVILGLLAGTLEVQSIQINRNQTVDILLGGSLKRKTKLDSCLDEIGAMPFDDVLKAIMGRL